MKSTKSRFLYPIASLLLAMLALSLVNQNFAFATTHYTFTKIASSRDSVTTGDPRDGFRFDGNDNTILSINDSGTVAFIEYVNSVNYPGYLQRINIGSGQTGQAPTPVYLGNGNLIQEAALNNSGQVGFINDDNSQLCLFVGPGLPLQILVEDPFPAISTTFESGPFVVSINNNGAVAYNRFISNNPPTLAVFRYNSDGSITTIASEDTLGQAIYSYSSINSQGTVAFDVTSSGGSHGIMIGNGGPITSIIQSGDAFPVGVGTVYDVGVYPSIRYVNNADMVAFQARSDADLYGIFTKSGSTTNLIADTSSAFLSFSDPGLNDHGNVAFHAVLKTGSSLCPGGYCDGIYTGPDPVNNKVIALNDGLDNSTVYRFNYYPAVLNNSGSIAFFVELADGTRGVYRADPVSPHDTQGPITSNSTATPNPVAFGTVFTLTATVTDASTGGSTIASAEYSIEGGPYILMNAVDGFFSQVTENVTVNAVPPTAIGVYNICIRGTDSQNNVGAPECILVPVYDPSAGFVTGGGWIISQPGAYLADATLTGKANFGFVSKYEKGKSIPTGETEFQFQVASFKFNSTVYDWLVVTGAKAQYQGSGTVNGTGVYQFVLTAKDGNLAVPAEPDKFRIKITSIDPSSPNHGKVVYDNQRGQSTDLNTAEPQAISAGSIVIHKTK